MPPPKEPQKKPTPILKPKNPLKVLEGPADIRLEENRVVVDAPIMAIIGNRKDIGTDLDIDNAGRRTESENPRRRALVHDFDDKLTLNWGKDYPGGVKILGTVDVPGTLDADTIETKKIVITHRVNSGSTQPVLKKKEVKPGQSQPSQTEQTQVTLDVGEEVLQLKKKIASLEARISVLEKNP
jgi:hypothetical protein